MNNIAAADKQSVHGIQQFALFDGFAMSQPRQRTQPSIARLRMINGQFLATKRAGQQWQSNAIIMLRRFLKTVRASLTCEFTFEEFRLFCELYDMPAPRSLNAWGALPARACREGLCEWSGGIARATRPASHNRIIKVWVAL